MSNTSKLTNYTGASRKQANNAIQDLLVVEPQIYYDNRGENIETFCAKHYKAMFSSIDSLALRIISPVFGSAIGDTIVLPSARLDKDATNGLSGVASRVIPIVV